MARSSTKLIEQAAQDTGLGVVLQRDLPDADSEFGWQRPRAASSSTGNGAEIEVALPRTDTPQGTMHVLIRNPESPETVLVFTRNAFQRLIEGIKDGQYDMTV